MDKSFKWSITTCSKDKILEGNVFEFMSFQIMWLLVLSLPEGIVFCTQVYKRIRLHWNGKIISLVYVCWLWFIIDWEIRRVNGVGIKRNRSWFKEVVADISEGMLSLDGYMGRKSKDKI